MEKVVFSEREKLFLVQLVTDEKHILENKRTDGTTLKLKNEAWARITDSFNSQGFSSRSAKQLKKCWENIKQRKRKLNTTLRQEQLKTGGGPAQKVVDDPVMDFVDAAAPNLDVEVDCPWDSTAIYETQAGISARADTQEELIIIEGETAAATTSRVRNKKCEEHVEERNLRILKIKKEIENQQQLHSVRMRTAEMEYKLSLLKVKEQMRKMYEGMDVDNIDIENMDVTRL